MNRITFGIEKTPSDVNDGTIYVLEVLHTTSGFNIRYTMRWLLLVYLSLYSEQCLAIYSMVFFTKIANIEFTRIPICKSHGISVIICASKCNMDERCSAFNYNEEPGAVD